MVFRNITTCTHSPEVLTALIPEPVGAKRLSLLFPGRSAASPTEKSASVWLLGERMAKPTCPGSEHLNAAAKASRNMTAPLMGTFPQESRSFRPLQQNLCNLWLFIVRVKGINATSENSVKTSLTVARGAAGLAIARAIDVLPTHSQPQKQTMLI